MVLSSREYPLACKYFSEAENTRIECYCVSFKVFDKFSYFWNFMTSCCLGAHRFHSDLSLLAQRGARNVNFAELEGIFIDAVCKG